jgi:hypothetical protein
MHLADSVPNDMLVVGPSLAYGSRVSASDHPVYGVDLTYTRHQVWGTLGGRLLHDDRPTLLPYAELGVWLGVNVGFGATFLLNRESEQKRLLAPHLFLGLPLPLGETQSKLWLLEPYYRPMWWQGGALHEVGVLLKVVIWTREAPRPARPIRTEPPLVDPVLKVGPP